MNKNLVEMDSLSILALLKESFSPQIIFFKLVWLRWSLGNLNIIVNENSDV